MRWFALALLAAPAMADVEIPRYANETASAGISSVYAGDGEFMTGGGVAAFDCSGDGKPELLLAGGTQKATLYRNDSPIGGALKFTAVTAGVELDRVTGAYPLDIDSDGLQRRMDGALNALKGDFASLRTGRASASMLDPIQVDAYGQMTPINQLGTINVPEPRMVVINVWDKGLIGKVEKAIRESGIGINPVSDGPLIRLPIPELNEQRRRELTKVAAQYSESAKVAVRNVRRDGMDMIKKAKTAGMGEDDQKMWQEEVQEMTDKAIAQIDRLLEGKQVEIMQV